MRNAIPEVLSPGAVRLLFDGRWPHAEGFIWERVDHFKVTSPNTLQGFDGFNEPIGPTIVFSVRVMSNDEEIESMKRELCTAPI